jgi:hypothetical protein
MVRQVFMKERFLVDGTDRTVVQAAFGSHPDPSAEDIDGVDGVNTATARSDQKIRIIVDELLLGSYIEEIACDALDSQGEQVFSRIPPEATPVDLDNCSPPELFNCTGENAICVVNGEPVGVLDTEQNGQPDRFRMIRYEDGQLAVRLVCDGGDGTLGTADDELIPLNPDTSFWNPSGNQLAPANACGLDCIGPALVINLEDGMRTGSLCGLSFQEEVFDKDLNRICAPPGGDVDLDCTPGDTSAISWTVEPLRVEFIFPAADAMNVPIASTILVVFNASIDPDVLANITVVSDPGGAATPVAATFALSEDDPTTVEGTATLAAGTTYEVTVPTTITDRFGGPLPQATVFQFTTAP